MSVLQRVDELHWIERQRLADARVLVVGAGAVGSQVVDQLARVGVGCIVVVDRDRASESNIGCGLFSLDDVGHGKAAVVQQRARRINPAVQVKPIVGDVEYELGWGVFGAVDVVVGACDNRRARLLLNSHACRWPGLRYIDGGVDGESLSGAVRVIDTADDRACLQCGWSARDYELLEQAVPCGQVPATAGPAPAVIAAPIAALMVWEVLQYLHGRAAASGRQVRLDLSQGRLWTTQLRRNPACYGEHGNAIDRDGVMRVGAVDEVGVVALWKRLKDALGPDLELQLNREIWQRLACRCGRVCNVRRIASGKGRHPSLCVCGGRYEAETRTQRIGPEDIEHFGILSWGQLGLPAGDLLQAHSGDGRQLTVAFAEELPARKEAPQDE